MDPILQPAQLNVWLNEGNVIVIDVRSELANPDAGEEAYKRAHIPSAYYLHLEKDLSGEKGKHGGNHPLPEPGVLAGKLRNMGVTPEKPVVMYDAANDMFAARAWWLLSYLGHQRVYVLDGGFRAWKEAGYGVTSEIPANREGTFIAKVQYEMTRSMDEVKRRGDNVVLLDARAPERYRGEKEPLYAKAGHIPGAKNYFWKEVLDDEGVYQSKAALQQHFRELGDADEIIVSCGSGVSACPNIMALKRAGFTNIKLYPGSYSDWISYEKNTVDTGEDE